jgi:hypothetical protein
MNFSHTEKGLHMKLISHRPILLAVVLFWSSLSITLAAPPPQNVLINIGDGAIPGNATVPGFENQTVVKDFSFGVSQAGEWEGGGGANYRKSHLFF